MNDITPKEAIVNLNHLYEMVAPDMQRSLDVAIKALERPQGDCISREALKEHKVYSEERHEYVVPVYNIDNAQAVDLWQLRQEATENALKKAEVLYDRPKGEWLEYNATGKKQYMCSECGMKEKNPKIARYCYWCGAKMKGGAE